MAVENKDFCDLYIVVDIIAFHFVLKIVIVVKVIHLMFDSIFFSHVHMEDDFLCWHVFFLFLSSLTNSPDFEPRGLISYASPFPSHPRNVLSLMLLYCSSSVQELDLIISLDTTFHTLGIVGQGDEAPTPF